MNAAVFWIMGIVIAFLVGLAFDRKKTTTIAVDEIKDLIVFLKYNETDLERFAKNLGKRKATFYYGYDWRGVKQVKRVVFK